MQQEHPPEEAMRRHEPERNTMHPIQMETKRTMKLSWPRTLLTVAICLVVSLVWLCPASAAESRGAGVQKPPPATAGSEQAPSIQILEKAYDFGEVLEGAEVTHVYAVKNTGKAPLQITQVRPG
jgi:hypothetical protein